MSNCLYFLQNTLSGLVKIGITQNFDRRKRQLDCANGTTLAVLGTLDGTEVRRYERVLHNHLRNFRRVGEWFEPSEGLLAVARNIDKWTVSEIEFLLENWDLIWKSDEGFQ